MFTLLLLSIAFILFVLAFIIFSVGGAALMIVFGDLLFAIVVIWLIIKLIRRNR